MKTRSQSKKENQSKKEVEIESKRERMEYEVEIDFDGASEAWKANKKSIGNGSYKYICTAICKSGKK